MIDRAIDEAITYGMDVGLLLEPCESQEELDARQKAANRRQEDDTLIFDPFAGIVTVTNADKR